MAAIAYSWGDKAEQYGTGMGVFVIGGILVWLLIRNA
tara:strand:+ start:1604 stop:1714 length:111 start_codon:yes stop_codon:yes gene_type:complete